MNHKLLNEDRQKTYALILEEGDEAISTLSRFAQEQDIAAAQFTAIGAFSNTTVGFYDFKLRDYRKIYFDEQMEVLSITGDISRYQDKPQVHAHAVLGRSDGSAHGGHLLEGKVHPTLEVILIESPVWLRREMDDPSGIPLIKISE